MNIDDACKDVKLVLLDVDGVLTDGSIIVSDDGREMKRFNARDGSGIKYLQRAGLRVAFLSGRKTEAVDRRAVQLGVEDCLQGFTEKIPPYESLLEKRGLEDKHVCFLGDDLMDIPVMRRAAFPVAVADAAPEVKAEAVYVTEAEGGRGAVREVAELILRYQGKWDAIISRYGLTSGDGP
ncbi:MAG: HAD-IIIA family hydrolase [Planctomycetota bacterium]|nr:MAG: HAD-IIIA family hydrolase [Planctomycetota bacterium]